MGRGGGGRQKKTQRRGLARILRLVHLEAVLLAGHGGVEVVGEGPDGGGQGDDAVHGVVGAYDPDR